MSSTSSTIELSADPSRLRLPEIQVMLAATYWTPGITAPEIEKGIRNSALVVGAYSQAGRQVGFLRVVSDKVRFAYILDVVVADDHQRQGIGQRLVNFAMSHPEMRDVYQWLLVTRDAHGVYEKCGFKKLPEPDRWMMIKNPRPDRPNFPG
ncbi:MAG: GNAT family N-acetyltransferase [candidate division Zixibacteria bacterium]|nr:GNAT family N-acetyltransferase [candidate division Zixibacteria bacterium]